MFGNRKTVLEMPADSAVGGGSLGYAGFWARVAAVLVDSAILMIVGVLLFVVLGMAMGGTGLAVGNIIFFFVQLLYWPVMESSARQATFGKRLLGIEVTDIDGNRTSFVRSLLRNLAKIISSLIFGIGFLLAAFTGRKQALHDMITSCLVVRTGPSNFLMAVVAAVAALAIAFGAAYYYVTKVYLPQTMDSGMKGAGKDFQRDMEKAMKEAEKDMKRQMEQAARDAQKAASSPPPAATAAVPAPTAPPPAAAPAKPTPGRQVAATAPGARPASKPSAVPEKPAAVALAPSRPAAVAIKPMPARPAAEAAPSADDKPKAKRRAAPRRPAAVTAETAIAPAEPPKSPRYNDVMTAVMNRDRAGAVEALDAGFWADRRDSNGVTPLMAAAMNGDIAMAQLLLQYGADPNRSSPAGSVLGYANRGGNAQLVELLRKAGAR